MKLLYEALRTACLGVIILLALALSQRQSIQKWSNVSPAQFQEEDAGGDCGCHAPDIGRALAEHERQTESVVPRRAAAVIRGQALR